MKEVFLVLILLTFACQKKVEIREVKVDGSLFKLIEIAPDEFKENKFTSISSLADSVTYIPLETEDEFLVGEITKMIVWNDRFYIWDRKTETIFCFGPDGKFIHQIKKRGAGPGEYPRIADFNIHPKTGDVYVHSDEGQGTYQYTSEGDFVKKIRNTLVFSTFAMMTEDTIICYTSNLPNRYFYEESFPEQCRYVVLHNNKIIHQQLKYTYRESLSHVALSRNNFSLYNDTLLLTEHMTSEIYSIDANNQLIPRYRISFLTNTLKLSFDKDVNLEQMRSAENSGHLTTLSSFYETDDYLLMNYARVVYGFAYVNKHKNTIHNMGYSLFDDINTLPMSSTFLTVDNRDHVYMETEPELLLSQIKQLKMIRFRNNHLLEEVATKIDDTSNPIIIKLKLKKL